MAVEPQVEAQRGNGARGPEAGNGTPGTERSRARPAAGRQASPGKRRTGPARERVAANDDVPSIGALIYALQQQPSSAPFFYAGIGTAVWTVLGAVAGWAIIAANVKAGEGWLAALVQPMTIAALVLLFAPIALMWFLALLVWRAQELRLMSSAMTEVAVRLAEPDRMAEQSIAALGQSVRRQVSAMNDAISRAIGRAGELEVLVQNEVSALERSYDENESRIRNLIDELVSEREALAGGSDRLADTLKGVGAQITDQIHTAGQTVAEELSERGNVLHASMLMLNDRIGSELPTLLERLSEQQGKLASVVDGAAANLDQLHAALDERTDRLDTTLGLRSSQLQSMFDERVAAIDAGLGGRTGQLQSLLDDRVAALDVSLGTRTGQLQGLLDDRLAAIDGNLGTRAGQLQGLLDDRLAAIDGNLGTRAGQLQGLLDDRLAAIDGNLGARTGQLQGLLETYSESINTAIAEHTDTLSTRLGLLTQTIEHTNAHIDSVISGRTDALDAALVERTRAIDAAFATRMAEIDDSIMRSSIAVEGAISRGLKAVEAVVAQGAGSLDNAIGSRVELLRNALERHAATMGTTLRQQSDQLESTLVQGLDAMRRNTETITQQSNQTVNGLSSQSRVLREVSEGLISQLQGLVDRFDQQSRLVAQASSALESSHGRLSTTSRETSSQLATLAKDINAMTATVQSHMANLPAAARDSASGVRVALQDQIRALDQLSGLSREQRAMRDVTPAEGHESTLRRPAAGNLTERLQFTAPTPAGLPPATLAPLPAPPAATAYGAPLVGTPAAAPPAPLSAANSLPPQTRDAWSLGDLLARASQEDALAHPAPSQREAPPRETAAREAPAIDMQRIAAAIEPATAGQIWVAYRSGNRAAITRSAYAPASQATFDQLAIRSRQDVTFRNAIERYMADFESVLAQSDQRDPSGRTSLTQIVSEQGRVYVLLAHASGRLG